MACVSVEKKALCAMLSAKRLCTAAGGRDQEGRNTRKSVSQPVDGAASGAGGVGDVMSSNSETAAPTLTIAAPWRVLRRAKSRRPANGTATRKSEPTVGRAAKGACTQICGEYA